MPVDKHEGKLHCDNCDRACTYEVKSVMGILWLCDPCLIHLLNNIEQVLPKSKDSSGVLCDR